MGEYVKGLCYGSSRGLWGKEKKRGCFYECNWYYRVVCGIKFVVGSV